MNQPTPNPDDQSLRQLLQAAHPSADLPHGFSAEVWRRVNLGRETRSATTSPSWVQSLAGWLVRPTHAMGAFACILSLGLISGWLAGAANPHENASAQERYIASVTPFYLHSQP